MAIESRRHQPGLAGAFRPRQPVRQPTAHGAAGAPRSVVQHEPQGPLLGQPRYPSCWAPLCLMTVCHRTQSRPSPPGSEAQWYWLRLPACMAHKYEPARQVCTVSHIRRFTTGRGVPWIADVRSEGAATFGFTIPAHLAGHSIRISFPRWIELRWSASAPRSRSAAICNRAPARTMLGCVYLFSSRQIWIQSCATGSRLRASSCQQLATWIT